MKSKPLLIAGLAAAIFGGCVERRVIVREHGAVSEEIFFTEKPPVPQMEVAGEAPTRRHVWIGGFWAREGSRWVWRKGHWETPPHRLATYVPGRWEQQRGGWAYYKGHWK